MLNQFHQKHSHYQVLPLFLPMSFLDLNNDVKSIISKQLSNDVNICKMLINIMIFEKKYLVRLSFVTNIINLMILIMVKHIRYLMF